MVAQILSKTARKILVVGPVYNKIDKLQKAASLIPNYDYVIFNGGLCYPNHDLSEVRQRIKQMEEITKSRKSIYNISSHDIKLAASLDEAKKDSDIIQWIWSKPNVVIIEFASQSTMIITGGGVTPQMNR